MTLVSRTLLDRYEVLAQVGRAIPDLQNLLGGQPEFLRLALERELPVGLRVGGARQPASEILPDVASEKGGGAAAPVLPHVHELVSDKPRAFDRTRSDERRRRAREKDPPAEDDRIGAGERRQDPREKTAVEPGANELAGEPGAQAPRQSGRDRVSEQTTSRRGSFGAMQSASAPPCR